MNKTEYLQMLLNNMKLANTITDDRLEIKVYNKTQATIAQVIFGLIAIFFIVLAITLDESIGAKLIIGAFALLFIGLTVYMNKMGKRIFIIDKNEGKIKNGDKVIADISDIKNLHFYANGMVTQVSVVYGKNKKNFIGSYRESNKQSNFIDEFNNAFFDWLAG